MNITKESTGDLTATIKMEIVSGDYDEQVNSTLKDMQKKSTLKGFRPGKVPFGLIKKMYRTSAMGEEINKLISESLNNYIRDNKIELLGYPLASQDKRTKADFENDDNFEFFFDIGIAPDFNLDISDKVSVEQYAIKVEDKVVDNYVKESQQRFGNPVIPETVEAGDVVKGEIAELDEAGNRKEDGIKNETSISLNFIKDEKIQKEFIGKKKDDKVVFNPLVATGNSVEVSSMLAIKKEEAEDLKSNFEFTINEISRIEAAKVDKDLFNKVYPTAGIENEEQFREKLREEAEGYYQKESDNFMVHNAMDKLIHDTKVDLPDEFVKRWLIESDENITMENIDHDYEKYARSLKQQLILNKMSKDHDIKVEPKDIKDHIKGFFAKQYMFDLEDEEKSKQLDTVVDSVMQNKEETNKIYDELFDNQVKELFKSKLKLKKKSVTYEDFIKIVNEHHNTHNHEH